MPCSQSIVVCCWHHSVNYQVKSKADIGHPCLHTKAGFTVSHSVLEVVVEALDDKEDQLWNSICPAYACTIDFVDGCC